MRADASLLRGAMLVAALLALAADVRAQEEHVYRVKMFDCAHPPAQRIQTGFRVEGLNGIVTALHGVADCKNRTVSDRKGLLTNQPVNIVKVDIDRDVALLSLPPQLEGTAGGLKRAAGDTLLPGVGVEVYGYPLDINRLHSTLTLRKPPLTPLEDILPPAVRVALKERRSPNHLTQVINLQGNLLPGHSGAPILDTQGRVVGVANGGLKAGSVGISWAMPLQQIKWEDPSGRLRALAQFDPNIHFAITGLTGEKSDGIKDVFCEQLFSLTEASRTDFVSIVGAPLYLKGKAFKPKIELPNALAGYLYPHSYVSYVMYEDENAEVNTEYYNLWSKLLTCFPQRKWNKAELGGYKIYILRENDESPTIGISVNVEPHPLTRKYTVSLTVFASSRDLSDLWK